MALERTEPVIAMRDAGAEIASHGYRWIDYRNVPEAVSASTSKHLWLRITIGREASWFYQGRTGEFSRRLCVEEGGFVYDADSYSDDLPYYETVNGRPHLIVPYTLTPMICFASAQGLTPVINLRLS